jgi:D-glycero-alpha-D-manno-heptose-7-phosphate kinase
MKIVRSRAPFRISFAGGGTDIPPYCLEHGGQVMSSTINKYMYISMEITNKEKIKVISHDLDEIGEFEVGDYDLDGKFDLVKATLQRMEFKHACNIHIHSDLPARSGMGTSSALVVALIGAIACFQGNDLTRNDIAKLACKIEREDIKEQGGYQDQYAAAFGGFNFITFGKEVLVYPLKIEPHIIDEINYRLILYFTGKTRLSKEIQQQVLQNYEKIDFQEGMEALKISAEKIRDILVRGDPKGLDAFGKELHNAWISKQRLSEKISSPDIERLYMHALSHGAIGGKLLGAGGGGFVLLFSKSTERMNLEKNLRSLGGEITQFTFESSGVQSWRVA